MIIQPFKVFASRTIFGYALATFFLFSCPAAGAESTDATWDIGLVTAGQCLYSSLQQKRLPARAIRRIVAGLKAYLDFDRIPPDTAYRFEADRRGEVREFAIESGRALLILSLGRSPQAVRRSELMRAARLEAVSGQFQKDRGAGTIRMAGEAPELIHRLDEILSQDLDWGVEFEPGDCFRLVVEKIYEGRRLLRYGRIEAFELRKNGARSLIVRYRDQFYDQSGRSLKKQFLRVPLHFQYVSCQFMKARRHPILGGVRPHRGIDFAAPCGTPIWAIADGQVATAGWLSGFGRTVILRHAYGYESLYAHLSDFGPGIHEGGTVRQKQVIGYIGTTGLSTGPHLHFGLTRHGVYRDPLKEDFPRSPLLNETDLPVFQAKEAMLRTILAVDKRPEAASP